MMMDASNLAQSINSMLTSLDEHYTAAKKEVSSVKPDLSKAVKHAQAAHAFLGDLAVTIMRAKSFLGITQPPDVIQRVNTIYADLTNVEQEIIRCNAVVAAYSKRLADPKRVAN